MRLDLTPQINVMLDIIISYLIQILSIFGPLLLWGFLISLCSKWFYSSFGDGARIVCYVTGFIGTPVHELSHALFCLIFGHKITEIKLFQINSADGTLGYVNHSYNPKNIYQRAGNFFIGIAPIIVISAILYGLGWLLIPDVLSNMAISVQSMSSRDIGSIFEGMLSVLQDFFLGALSWQWWAFVFVSMFFALHMNLSGADIKGSLSGIIFVLGAILIVDTILGLIGTSVLEKFNEVMFTIGTNFSTLLLVALMVSCILAVTSKVTLVMIRKIKK